MVISGEPVGCFTDSAEDLNSGLLGTNPASGQGTVRTRTNQLSLGLK